MNTGVIQIGNSDDKLRQEEWAAFVGEVNQIIQNWQFHVYFMGYSPGNAPWQNACWVFHLEEGSWIEDLRSELSDVALKFKQDSIALTLGTSEMVESHP